MLTSGLVLAVFLGALVSGWHCALMCGGIASTIERQGSLGSQGKQTNDLLMTFQPLKSRSQLFYLQLIMHIGRLVTYVLLGGLAAWIGVAVWQQNLIPIQRPLFALTSLILLLMGVRLLRQNRTTPLFIGKWLGSHLASYWAQYLGRFASYSSRWFSGMLWGLVPCGLVYSVLPLAFLSGDIWTGAALMLAFGLGTLPNLLLISKFSATLTQFGQYAWVRYLAAGLLLVAGIFGLYRAWYLPDALLKGGFCIT
ncbi:sulfite exporter TauE/SafE family protein [Polynucleobacter antarcticus]|uniref:Sulfite exporter TauE/SafE family protein n=1 Tax=Polynucleobacter antarcticus TaxID=1743162 RepID=A0A6M9PZ65_9BURK|nr:sulfite exporter TauE/SafE family protein [Polynucleobacter antarcticus]QKM63126.1 sulfite exporter TauE/SafE family protein [Polynucleobacter antarcticus]